MAVGVNSGLPSTQSPIANILWIEVLSSAEHMIFPFLFNLTPIGSKFNFEVSLVLPVANKTVSYISSFNSLSLIQVTFFLPSAIASIDLGVAP